MEKVSVIVPVYNVEDYLRECLDSIAAQSHTALEVILVDDGSTDSSGAICDEYAARDARFSVIHRANGGLSAARNTGLDAMTADYVTVVDADDVIHREMIERMMAMIHETDADVATCDFRFADNADGFATSSLRKLKYDVVSGAEATQLFLYQRRIRNNAWGKLYRRRMFASLRYTPGITYEDLDLGYRILHQARRVAVTDERLYFYRRRRGSILNTVNAARFDVLDVVDRMSDYIYASLPEATRAADDRRFSAACNILRLLRHNGLMERHSDEAFRCRAIISKLRWRVFTDFHSRLRSKVAALLPTALIARL